MGLIAVPLLTSLLHRDAVAALSPSVSTTIAADASVASPRSLNWPRATRLPIVIGLYVVAVAAWTFPLVLHLGDSMTPQGDPLLHSWILAWDIHALTTNPLHLYDANILFPFPLSLTYSDAMLSGALSIAPVLLLTGNPVLAHNVLTLFSLFLAAFGMFLLVRTLTGSDLASFLSGCIFSFCSIRQIHLEHVNLLQLGWLPLALLCLHRAFTRGHMRDYVLFALFTIMQALASFYLAWMMALAYIVFIVVELASRRSLTSVRRGAGVAAALLFAAAMVVPVSWPYVRAHQLFQYDVPLDMVHAFSAVPTDYLSASQRSMVFGPLLAPFANPYFPNEHALFPGIAALVLAIIGVLRPSNTAEVIRYGLIGLLAFVLSFGPFLQPDARSNPIPLPYGYLLQFVPDFGVMRVPARFDFLVMLSLAVLAGFGIARLRAVTTDSRLGVRRVAVLVGLAGVMVLDLVPLPLALVPVDVGASVPPVYGWLRSQDPGAPVAEIPADDSASQDNFTYEYLSTYHWHPLVNGSSGFVPSGWGKVRDELASFPDPVAVEHLRSLGVRFVIAHLDALDPTRRLQLSQIDLTGLGISIAKTFGSDVVYELPPPATLTPLARHVQLGLPTVVSRGRMPSITVTITNDQPGPLFIGGPEALDMSFEWDQQGSVSLPRQNLPLFVEAGDEVDLHVPTELDSRLADADSAVLRVWLAGSIDLESTQTVRFADLPTSVEGTGLTASIEHVRVPPTVQPDARFSVELRARNTGGDVWLPDMLGNPAPPGRVGVSVRNWITPDGKRLEPLGYSTAHLDWNVNPGQAASFTFTTPAPHLPGEYRLVLDMLSEDVTWFEDVHGGAQTIVPVNVAP